MRLLLTFVSLPFTCAATLIIITTSSTQPRPHQVILESLPTQTPLLDDQSPTTTTAATLYQTVAPDLEQNIFARQRCFNDQGFSVDCATWSGYRYTWGPPGNIYAGGPGDGSGGGSGGNGISSEAFGKRTVNSFQFGLMICAVVLMTLAFFA